MARIRSIKPEIRISETVNSWPVEVRYFWIMLWGYVDDHGRGRDNPKLIVADTYPLDDSVTAEHVSQWLHILARAGVIQRYAVAGKSYLAVTNWSEHQRPSHPAKSVIPEPPLDSADSVETPELPGQTSLTVQKVSGNPPESFAKVAVIGSPEQGAGSREQGADERVRKSPAVHVIPADFALTLDRRKWAKENAPAVHAERETEGFIDYWRGEGGKKKNWESTWRNWMRRKQTEAEAKGWKSQADLNSVVPAGYGWANR
jgi:hypothetical protein